MASIPLAAAGGGDVALVETHISNLFFVGDRVYKLKRPVRFAFLDFSTRELRLEACRREVELNRRLAPDVYLGVSTLLGPNDAPCDHLVVMQRMPADRKLSTLLATGARVEQHIRRIARVMAAFHARAKTSDEIAAMGTRDAVAESWEQNFREMQPFVTHLLPADEFEAVEALARKYLSGRAPLFSARVARGRVRDGHGDLLADDIFCLEDGPRILDCIEFNDAFRYADVIADIAFLAMDLERLGKPGLADRLIVWYREFSGDVVPESLVDHYIAYRALVRSKVACIRAEQGERAAACEAEKLVRLARTRLMRGRAVMLLIGGLPGTGKSTLARGIGDARGWTVLRSDEIRKYLAGIPHVSRAGGPFNAGIYTSEMTERTYAEMLARARRALEMGESVVLDASWTNRRLRDMAASAASNVHADLIQFRCAVPHAIAAERLLARNAAQTDASDATPEVARDMRMRADPWPEARTIDTAPAAEDVLRTALEAIDAPRQPRKGYMRSWRLPESEGIGSIRQSVPL